MSDDPHPEEFLSKDERIANRGNFFRIVFGDKIERGTKEVYADAVVLQTIMDRLFRKEISRQKISNWKSGAFGAVGMVALTELAKFLIDFVSSHFGHKP